MCVHLKKVAQSILLATDAAGLPPELTRILTMIGELDNRAAGGWRASPGQSGTRLTTKRAAEAYCTHVCLPDMKLRIEQNVETFLQKQLPPIRKGTVELPREVRMTTALGWCMPCT